MKPYAVMVNGKVDAEFEGCRAAEEFWEHLSYLHQTYLVEVVRRVVLRSSAPSRVEDLATMAAGEKRPE